MSEQQNRMANSDRSIVVAVEGAVLRISINRPGARNALDAKSHHALHQAFDQFHNDPALRVAILTGAGDRAFCAGSDLRDRAATGGDSFPSTGFGGLCQRFDLCKPLVALVNGDCIGGGLELVLAADMAVAVPSARFGLPEPRVGLAASGGLHRLARQIGLKQAMEISLTGRLFDAAEMKGFGVINHVAKDLADAEDKALNWAQDITKGAPLAVSATKQMILSGLDHAGLSEAFSADYPAFVTMLDSEDAKEGTRAFLARRDPVWTGK